MNNLLQDARQLAKELSSSGLRSGSVESSLLSALELVVQTLEIDGRPQRGSIDALSRVCTASLDLDSPLFRRCTALIEQARAEL